MLAEHGVCVWNGPGLSFCDKVPCGQAGLRDGVAVNAQGWPVGAWRRGDRAGAGGEGRCPATPLYVSEFAHGAIFPYNWEIARILFKFVTGAEGPNAALPIFGKEGSSAAAKPRQLAKA